MQHHLKLRLGLSFSSKWHAGSGEGNILTDRLIQKDARGILYIPASTLKGVIRESCEKVSRTLGFSEPSDPHNKDLNAPGRFSPLRESLSPVDRLFGNNYEEGGLFFRNAHLKKGKSCASFAQSRVHMYRKLGTAKKGHLFSTEYGIPEIGKESAEFETVIEGFHRHLLQEEGYEDYPPIAYNLLIAAIRMVGRLGGDKSTGAGFLKKNIEIQSIVYNDQEIPIKDIWDLSEIFLDATSYEELYHKMGES